MIVSILSRIALAIAALVILASPNTSFGQTIWTAGTDDWFTAGNWTLGVPNSASGTAFDAIIANGGTAQLEAVGGSVRRLRLGGVGGGVGHLIVNGGTLNVTDDLHLGEGIVGGATMYVQGGATVNAIDTVVQYSSDDSCYFQITGAGTVYNATTSFIVGRTGNGIATLSVDSGAVLASGTSSISSNGGFGNATVDGAGSRWSTTGTFNVGGVSAGTLNIQNEGVVHVGTALTIGSTSNVTLNGGTLRFNTISGITRVTYTAGTIQLAGNRDIILDGGLFDFYGVSRIIPAGKGLTVEGTTTIRQDKILTVNGGKFTSQGLLTLGAPGLSSGDLIISNGGTVVAGADVKLDAFGIADISGAGSSWTVAGSFQVSPTGGRGDLSISNQASLYIGNTLSLGSSGTLFLSGGTVRFNGYSRNALGAVNYSGGTVQLAGNRTLGTDAAITDFFGASPTIPMGKALIVEGIATLTPSAPVTLSGGALSASTVLMTPGSQLTNTLTSQVSGAMLALAGSVIDSTGGDLTVGDASKVNGFYGSGSIQVGQRTVTLNDANDAVLDSASLVTLGAGGSPGTLAAANGLTLNFGGNITGFGTVETLDSAATPFINNGHVTGNSVDEPITLTGYIKGVGTLDNVVITGTDAPGFSPATVVRGSVDYDGVLQVELGGTSVGSFDQINHILGAGIAELGGILDVTLINNFNPILGNSFDILTASGSVDGVFATMASELPELSEGLAWSINYGSNNVVLAVIEAGLPGDYNDDDVVNAADYVVWRDQLGSTTSPPNDSTPGVDAGDYGVWQANFGAPSGAASSSTAAVPEPATALLLLVGMSVAYACRRGTT